VTCEDVVIATHNPLVGFTGMAGATLFSNEAGALHQLRDRRTCRAPGVVPDATVVGHGGPPTSSFASSRTETMTS